MAIVGPWAIAVYGDKVDWGAVPVPTKDGKDAKDVSTFSDEKSIGMYTSCVNRGTAWEFLKFATSKDNDGMLLEGTGQMPMRTDLVTTYPDYFKAHPEYTQFADQACPDGRGPHRPELDRGLADLPGCVQSGGDLRQEADRQAFKDAATKVKSLISEG